MITFNVVHLQGQEINCKKFHVGKFRHVSDVSGTTQIVRTKNTQTEVNEKLKVKVVYDIRWIDDCTYEISNRRIISEKNKTDKDEMNFILNVKILRSEGNKVFVSYTSNFSDDVYEGIMYKDD
ncbi:hypothetical protein [Flavobacterium cerinum]|uniref:Uncharacterized protein n=1 Tax=Flavobacterium cerinum TaxID=2502784 RepID=A0ABY5IQV5_9FLAO|nr:hypothetical protein [Flavobacterium cerinum]UUC44163.1 hypothetical protein NOX80_11015 [Flavobacterium cerinum]